MKYFAALWRFLTEPAPRVTHPERRRQSRLLMSLLVVITALWVLVFFSFPLLASLDLPGGKGYIVTVIYPLLLLGMLPLMLSSYFLARYGHHAWGSRILVTSISAAGFFDIITTKDANILGMPLIALVLCGVLLTPLDALQSAVVTFVGYLLIVGVLKIFTVWEIYGALVLVGVVATLSEINVVIRARDVRHLEQQSRDLIEFQAQLVEAHKMEAVGRLSAGLAHELNNILAAINGYVEIIRSKRVDSLRPFTDKILQATDRAVRLTDGLLAFGQQQAMKLELVDIDDALRKSWPDLESAVLETTRLRLTISTSPKRVAIDVELFIKATQALIALAEQHLSGPGEVGVETDFAELVAGNEYRLSPGPYCLIRVVDSGTAISDEVGSRVFDPFFTTGEFGTGGLDFAAAWGIVRQFNGQIVLESTPPRGNLLRVALPCTGHPL